MRVLFHRHPDVVAQRMGEEAVLVHLRTNAIFTLNRTAARLWEHLASGIEGSTRQELERQLLAEFEVSAEQLAAELDPLLASLTDRELIVVEADQ